MPAWQAGIDAVGLLWERLKAGAQAAWQSLVAGVAATWDAIASAWNAGVERVIGYLTKLRDFAVGVWNAIVDAAKRAFGAQQQAAGAATLVAVALRGGGPVFGRGTATSDSIPAWLSNGEFVVRAAAVRKYGLSLLHSLNRMRLDPERIRALRRRRLGAPDADADAAAVAIRRGWSGPGRPTARRCGRST